MKKVSVTVLTVLAVLIAVSLAVPQVQAQEELKPMSIYLGGGVSVPTGDAGDIWKFGFHGLGRVGFNVAPKLDILAGVDFHTFSFDDQGASGFSGGGLTSINLTGDLKVNLGAPGMSTNPFVLGGVGLGIAKASDLTVTGVGTFVGDSESKAFIEVGGGAEFNKFFILGRYVSIFTSGSSISYIPITVGVKF